MREPGGPGTIPLAAADRSEPADAARRREEFARGLHEAHGRVLFAFTLGKLNGDRQAAEDIVQETMLRAWQHADTAGALAAPRAWLLTVAHRLVIDRWRSLSARPKEVADADLRHLAVRDHSDAAVSGLLVRDALAGLSEKHRAVIVHVYLWGHSVNETAAMLNIPPGTVKSRLHNAARAMRAALEEKGAKDD
jgi:RNA polymerase sigma-70 factor (ECF subfamily)